MPWASSSHSTPSASLVSACSYLHVLLSCPCMCVCNVCGCYRRDTTSGMAAGTEYSQHVHNWSQVSLAFFICCFSHEVHAIFQLSSAQKHKSLGIIVSIGGSLSGFAHDIWITKVGENHKVTSIPYSGKIWRGIKFPEHATVHDCKCK